MPITLIIMSIDNLICHIVEITVVSTAGIRHFLTNSERFWNLNNFLPEILLEPQHNLSLQYQYQQCLQIGRHRKMFIIDDIRIMNNIQQLRMQIANIV